MNNYIGVDIGGTKIHSALVDEKGRILKENVVATEAEKGRKKTLENISSAIEAVFPKEAIGIGIGCPGPLDIKKGKILNTPNLPLKNFTLRNFLERKFRKNIKIDNDANCFVLGEAIYGAGKKHNIVAGFTLGTGIGGGIVVDRKVYQGRGNAGEFGHTIINFDGQKGKCGHHGCLESYAGKHAIIESAKKIGCNSPLELYNEAKKNNKKAINTWKEIGFCLGIGIANVVDILDPDIVVIGGNVSGAFEFFEKNMKKTAREKSILPLPPIVKAKLGGNAAVLGAARLAMK